MPVCNYCLNAATKASLKHVHRPVIYHCPDHTPNKLLNFFDDPKEWDTLFGLSIVVDLDVSAATIAVMGAMREYATTMMLNGVDQGETWEHLDSIAKQAVYNANKELTEIGAGHELG